MITTAEQPKPLTADVVLSGDAYDVEQQIAKYLAGRFRIEWDRVHPELPSRAFIVGDQDGVFQILADVTDTTGLPGGYRGAPVIFQPNGAHCEHEITIDLTGPFDVQRVDGRWYATFQVDNPR